MAKVRVVINGRVVIVDDTKLSKCFHKGGVFHDTYAEQEKYVRSLGNKWAMENFEATKPYFY